MKAIDFISLTLFIGHEFSIVLQMIKISHFGVNIIYYTFCRSLIHMHMCTCDYSCHQDKAMQMVYAYLDFKAEIFLEVLDDHNKKRKLDAQCLVGFCREWYVGGTASSSIRKNKWINKSVIKIRQMGLNRAWKSWPEVRNHVKTWEKNHLILDPATSTSCELVSSSLTLSIWSSFTCKHCF